MPSACRAGIPPRIVADACALNWQLGARTTCPQLGGEISTGQPQSDAIALPQCSDRHTNGQDGEDGGDVAA